MHQLVASKQSKTVITLFIKLGLKLPQYIAGTLEKILNIVRNIYLIKILAPDTGIIGCLVQLI